MELTILEEFLVERIALGIYNRLAGELVLLGVDPIRDFEDITLEFFVGIF